MEERSERKSSESAHAGPRAPSCCPRCEQGGRKDGRRNEPVGSCAMFDARSTGPEALESKEMEKWLVRTKLATAH